MKKKKTPNKNYRWYVKKIDETFSKIVRLSEADPNGYCRCITCGTVRHYKDSMHAGHFIPRTYMGVRWNKDNVHPQCCRCNTFNEGEGPEYFRYMQDTYGDEVIDELRANKLRSWSVSELVELYDEMKLELKGLT